MKRPIVTLALVGLVAFPMLPGCNQTESPDEDGGNSGSSNSSAGTGNLVIPMAGSANASAGSANVAPTAGSGAGGANTGAAGTSAGGAATAGTAAGGASAGTSAGGAAGGTAGAGSNPGCPAKIDSQVVCTMAISCNDAYCGVFQMGSKDCTCAAASGNFSCTSCDYAGRTEEIVLPPAAVLPACAADDVTLEKNTPNCTKGMRCKSLTADKNRFCACWEDPTDASLKWDCDSQPSSWPK